MEDIIIKLKSIKALLFCVSQVDSEVKDVDYGLMLLCNELESCIKELETYGD